MSPEFAERAERERYFSSYYAKEAAENEAFKITRDLVLVLAKDTSLVPADVIARAHEIGRAFVAHRIKISEALDQEYRTLDKEWEARSKP